jgi:pimeloyl-ACP methyl ester carboxylesterase
MRVRRVTDLRSSDGHSIPAYLLEPDAAVRGAAVICHGYGSAKEEMFALALAVVEGARCRALCIDLRGHGENLAPIGAGVLTDVQAALAYHSADGPVVAIGHSLGGRLALMADADLAVAVSPAAVQEISPQGRWMFENFPSPFVREPYSGYVVELLDRLGDVPPRTGPCLLVHAARDIPNIIAGTKELAKRLPGATVHEVRAHLRPDVSSENGLVRYLPRWYNHGELKSNPEVSSVVPEWVRARIGAT